MKAEELMIGDWVIAEEKFVQIVTLGSKRAVVSYGLDTAYYYDELQPIPLTHEILENNGFAKVFLERAYNLPDYRSDIWFSVSTDYFYFGFDGTAAQFTCQYVHELQHALKLCKIEKEIVL